MARMPLGRGAGESGCRVGIGVVVFRSLVARERVRLVSKPRGSALEGQPRRLPLHEHCQPRGPC